MRLAPFLAAQLRDTALQQIPVKHILSTTEVAKYLHCCVKHVHNLHNRGVLVGFRMPTGREHRHLRFSARVVREFAIANGIPLHEELRAA